MYNQALPRSRNRQFEWFAARTMFLCGAITLIAVYTKGTSPSAAFTALTQLGMSVKFIGWGFVVLGVLRLVALFLNGSWYYGPHVRVFCAAVGMLIWTQLLYALLVVFVDSGTVYLSIAPWISISIGEYQSITRAILDIRIKQPKLDADLTKVEKASI